MARFYGVIGFADTVETTPGIARDVIIERKFFGNVLRAGVRSVEGDHILPNPALSNSLSLVGSKYAFANVKNMRYIKYEGELWKIDTVTVEKPRMIIGMGDVYTGPTADPDVA